MESRSDREVADVGAAGTSTRLAPQQRPDINGRPHWRRRLNELVFRSDSRAGRLFDIIVIASIMLSVAALVIESIPSIGRLYAGELHAVEWFFTILFTIEYLVRLMAARNAISYARSFFGIVDLLAIAPVYLALFFPASHYLMVIRVLRLLRVFRIFHLAHYLDEANYLIAAIRASYYKILVFVFTVLTIVIVIGALAYAVEGEQNGFTSIWSGVYWAVGTLTTGDPGGLSPRTPFGQALSVLVMVMGYGVIAVPTGIVTVEMTTALKKTQSATCDGCGATGLDDDAVYCKYCGMKI